jgi:hypothetical protein
VSNTCLEPFLYKLYKSYFNSNKESKKNKDSDWGRTSGHFSWPSDGQVVSFFVSFPMTPISSKSDIWAESYDQNTGGCPDGKLQLPFQNSTESFHNKAASGRCCPSVRTVAHRLHVITIIRFWASGPWRLMSRRLNWCTQFPYMMLDRPDYEDWRPDGWTLYARLTLWRTSSGRDHTSSGRLQPSSHNCVFVTSHIPHHLGMRICLYV